MALFSATTSVQSVAAGSSATTATGQVLDNGASKANHAAICTAGTGVSAGAFQLQVSQDGVNWLPAATAVSLTAPGVTVQSLANTPAQYARAQITTTITGGTVGVTVASA